MKNFSVERLKELLIRLSEGRPSEEDCQEIKEIVKTAKEETQESEGSVEEKTLETIEDADGASCAEEETIEDAAGASCAEEETIEDADGASCAEEETIEDADAASCAEEEAIENADGASCAEEEATENAEGKGQIESILDGLENMFEPVDGLPTFPFADAKEDSESETDDADELPSFSELFEEDEEENEGKKTCREELEAVIEFLTEQGFRPTFDEDGDVAFKVEGLRAFISHNSAQYYLFTLGYVDVYDEKELVAKSKLAAKVNSKVKTAAVFVCDNFALVRTEAFYADVDDLLKVLVRIIDATVLAFREYRRIAEEENDDDD